MMRGTVQLITGVRGSLEESDISKALEKEMVWLGGKSAGERVFPAKGGDGGVEYQGQRQAGETRMLATQGPPGDELDQRCEGCTSEHYWKSL